MTPENTERRGWRPFVCPEHGLTTHVGAFKQPGPFKCLDCGAPVEVIEVVPKQVLEEAEEEADQFALELRIKIAQYRGSADEYAKWNSDYHRIHAQTLRTVADQLERLLDDSHDQ